jgi:hypothetical protein
MSTSQVIDKGRIVVAVDQYPEKINGQAVFIQGTQTPKMKNKWMAVGEATKWRHGDGSVSTNEKIYLKPVNCQGAFYEQKTFWDSEQQQQAPQQQGGFQQQAPQQQGSYQQARHR